MSSKKICFQGKEIPQKPRKFLWPARRQLPARRTEEYKEYRRKNVMKGGK